MKIVIIILSAIVLLFSGGCALMIVKEVPHLSAMLLGIAVFSGVYIWAALKPGKAAGLILVVFALVDLILAGLLTQAANDKYVGPLAMIAMGVLAVKAVAAGLLGHRKLQNETVIK